MYLSVRMVASFAAFTILMGLSAGAPAQDARLQGDAGMQDATLSETPGSAPLSDKLQPKDWIHLDGRATGMPGGEYGAWSPREEQPVLLPLPAEGWAGAGVLLSIVVYRGVRRARLLAMSR